MTQEDKNNIISVLKNYDNIATLMGDLFMPIKDIMQKYNCINEEEAVNIKLKAEEYLSKYGVLTLTATTKAVRNIINKTVTIEEEKETLVPTDAR